MIAALIPAKGKSSRVKKKNLLKINGKTLVERAIIDCKKSKLIDEFFVSSEDKKIYEISKKNKINFVKRPKNLSKINTPMSSVINHFIFYLKKKKINPKTIVLIQPTSPFRPSKIIDKLILKYKRMRIKSLITIKKTESYFFKTIIKEKKALKIKYPKYFFGNTQKLPKTYIANGMVYIFDVNEFLKEKQIPLKKVKFFEIKIKNDIDIDTMEEFLKAKKIYEKKS